MNALRVFFFTGTSERFIKIGVKNGLYFMGVYVMKFMLVFNSMIFSKNGMNLM
jgi:hypothetical protein